MYEIHPGHRISAGSNIFALLQHINFSIGNNVNLIIEEFSGISDFIKTSIYGIIEGIGTPLCTQYIRRQLVEKLRQNAKVSELDVTSYLYYTLAEILYKSFEELDQGFMEENPYYGASSGCTICFVLMIGRKLVVANLGDTMGYLCSDELI